MGERLESLSSMIQDVEEGEISDDTASVEEITEEDFVKPPEAATKVLVVSNQNSEDPKPRVWTMRDLYKYQNKYQTPSNYASGLYHLAWSQAVQNKPLDEILEFNNTTTTTTPPPTTPTTDFKRSGSSVSINDDNYNNNNKKKKKSDCGASASKDVSGKVVIDVSGDEADDDKMEVEDVKEEEGELEEGEIDLDSEPDVREAEEEVGSKNNDLDHAPNISNVALEKRVKLIRDGLEAVIVNDEGKSYEGVCSRLQNSLDSLWELVLENSVPKSDALVQLSFSAIQTVSSVFSSMNQNKEQNSDSLLRLLAHVTSKKPPLFSPEQMKEIEVMIPSPESCAVSSSFKKECDKAKDLQFIWRVNQTDLDSSPPNSCQDLTSIDKFVLDSISVESSDQNNPQMLLESLKMGAANSKGRGTLLPLLDLHKDHDADSLPSPTREAPPCMLVDKELVFGDGSGRPEFPVLRGAPETEKLVMHPYETDALKAVSFYQQKFGRSSFHMNNRLPSPTPSEEGDDGYGDTSGEVSSSSIASNVHDPVNIPTLACPTVSSMLHVDTSGGQGPTNFRIAVPLSSGLSSVSRPAAKSRDPRLRLVNSDSGTLDLNQRPPLAMVNNEPNVDPLGGITISSRKQKTVEEESILDGAPKKLENAVTCSGPSSSLPSIINENGHLPVTSANATASVHSLLKDIAVNPDLWKDIFKMQQQKSVDPAKILSFFICCCINIIFLQNSFLSFSVNVYLLNLFNCHVLKKVLHLSPSYLSRLELSAEGRLLLREEPGKIRMKPRDPRRVLHSNSSQKGGRVGSDQSKTNTSSAQGKANLSSQKQENQVVKTSGFTQSTSPPDIGRQFTKNLKNIANIISISQASANPPVTQIPSSQPVQVHPSWVDIKGVLSESGILQSGLNSSSEEVAAAPPQSQNTWREVEHLFEGFDDQQKAAIQRERERRIEEQKKMFAARKLCLVLDLDHTLLNSAKFVEIEPAHDELLRKKEEQDREKPQRHLFRFPHMGMWTKLRPGIWNFLEKASKLFELHLYTMGNKLYATEMAKVLDPKGVLFSGRVISKGDDGDLIDGDERIPKSKDLEGVLGMESAVVIIDDSVRVWPHNKLNLIVVERYIYFPCSRRQFGLPGPSLLEIDHDERPEDGTLASSLSVIERIHQNFFLHESLDEADVRNILASEQQKILGGCRIVFSRVFPVGEANPHLHPLWQTAEQFGAVCTNQIDEQVTHVVANSLGTDKVNWALSTGRFVVHPGWVEASALLYRRVNEHDFAVKP
ncbi:hypothetical protein LguiA_032902 [Lonicera macranthoides]